MVNSDLIKKLETVIKMSHFNTLKWSIISLIFQVVNIISSARTVFKKI